MPVSCPKGWYAFDQVESEDPCKTTRNVVCDFRQPSEYGDKRSNYNLRFKHRKFDGSAVSVGSHQQRKSYVPAETRIQFVDDFVYCKSCLQGRQHKASYRSKANQSRASSIGVLHADLCSPSLVSLREASHFLYLTDEFSTSAKSIS